MKYLTSIIAAGVYMAIFTGCSEKSPENTRPSEAICVKARILAETDHALAVQYPGILSAKQVIKLSFKTGGIIAGIQVNEGSRVRKGQVLALLDMTEIGSQVNQSGLALDKAKRDMNRIKSLYTDTVATLEQLQDATSAYEAAVENFNIAHFNQHYSRITAPANGRIIARLAEEHEVVGPGMPVLVFCEDDKEEWVVKTGLSDRDIVRIRKGDKAIAEFDAFPGKKFSAYVSQMAETVDPQSGTFEVEVTVIPQQERLLNGLIAKVTIEYKSEHTVTLVPPEALTEGNGSKGYIFTVDEIDTTARKVPVTIAYIENEYIAVLESVKSLGQVITEGASYVEDGSKISIQQ